MHIHKRGNVKLLATFGSKLFVNLWLFMIFQDIAVTFSPGRIADFSDNIFESIVVFVEAIVETDRVETEAKATQIRQNAYRPDGTCAFFVLDKVSDCLVQRFTRIAQVITTLESRHGRSLRRPEKALFENLIDLRQVEVHHIHGVVKCVLRRRAPQVPNSPVENGALHDQPPSLIVLLSAMR